MGKIYEIPINTIVTIEGIFVADDRLAELGYFDAENVSSPINGIDRYCQYSYAGRGSNAEVGKALKPLNLETSVGRDIDIEGVNIETFVIRIRAISKDSLKVENFKHILLYGIGMST